MNNIMYQKCQSLPRPAQVAIAAVISLVTLCVYVFANAIGTIWIIAVRVMQLCQVNVDDIDRKHVVVTGCDSGFGKVTALRLAKKRFSVHAGCYTSEGLIALQKEAVAEKLGSKLNVYLLDISSQTSVNSFKKRVVTVIPKSGLWAIVNNAGVLCQYIEDSHRDFEDFRTNMEVNFFGTVRMIHAFVPLMNSTLGGRVVVLCSSSSHQATELVLPYVASKNAIFGYADSLRLELLSQNIKVITVSPGFYKTPLYSNGTTAHLRTALEGLPSDKRQSAEEIDRLVNKRESAINSYMNLMTCLNTADDVPDVLNEAVCLRHPKLHHRVGYDSLSNSVMPHCWAEVQAYFFHYARTMVLGDLDLNLIVDA